MRFRSLPAPDRLTREGRAPRTLLPLGAGRLADVRITSSRVRATPTAVDTLARDKLDRPPRVPARRRGAR